MQQIKSRIQVPTADRIGRCPKCRGRASAVRFGIFEGCCVERLKGRIVTVRVGRQSRMVEIGDQGDPQVFPFTNACISTLTRDPQGEAAQSIRDHREAYRVGHTTDCESALYRGLCH